MIVVMRTGATAEQIDEVKREIEEHGLEAYVSQGEERTVIGVVGTRTWSASSRSCSSPASSR